MVEWNGQRTNSGRRTVDREPIDNLGALDKDIKHLNPVEIEAMVLNHEQQIKDIATHLLELKQSMFKPGMSLTTEFNPVIPVAWMWDQAKYIETDVRGRCWSPMIGRMHPMNPQMTRNIVPLYTKEKNGG